MLNFFKCLWYWLINLCAKSHDYTVVILDNGMAVKILDTNNLQFFVPDIIDLREIWNRDDLPISQTFTARLVRPCGLIPIIEPKAGYKVRVYNSTTTEASTVFEVKAVYHQPFEGTLSDAIAPLNGELRLLTYITSNSEWGPYSVMIRLIISNVLESDQEYSFKELTKSFNGFISGCSITTLLNDLFSAGIIVLEGQDQVRFTNIGLLIIADRVRQIKYLHDT
jgi:hypothetical protein